MRGAHVGNNATASPPGADGLEAVKPTWQIEFPPGTTEGYRVLSTIELDDAPGYVAPAYFKATYDDPTFPCLLTLFVRLRRTESPVVSIHLDPRLDQYNVDLWEEDGRTSQLELSPNEHLGLVPEIPSQRLLREALMRVAMPKDQPFIDRCGSCTGDMPNLPVRRAPRTSLAEWKAIRQAYKEALADSSLAKKYEVRDYVYDRVHEAFPDNWERRDGKTPDYDRLRRYLQRIDRESRGDDS